MGDYDSRILELQSDIEELRKELEEQNALQKNTEKEKAQLLQELTEQNHRLTAQLKQVGTFLANFKFKLIRCGNLT